MKKNTYLFLLIVSIVCYTKKVQSQTFTINMSTADSLLKEGDLNGAIKEFHKLYLSDPNNANNLYNYACALSQAKQNDTCFKYLQLAVRLDTSIVALSDADFLYLRKDKHWLQFEDELIRKLELKNKKPIKDLTYAKKLWKMCALDQAYYRDITIAEKKIGMNSTVVNALWDLKDIINNKNQKELERLIQNKGWPKISAVGHNASSTAFLIIQHSDIAKQKIYLPTIKKLCEVKEADWQNYALMYDRIQVSENKPQKYGSQIHFNQKTQTNELYPLENESKVEDWRKELGMESLADYLSMWDIKFEPNK